MTCRVFGLLQLVVPHWVDRQENRIRAWTGGLTWGVEAMRDVSTAVILIHRTLV